MRLDARGPSFPTKDGIARLSAVLVAGVVLLALSPLPVAGEIEARAGSVIAPVAGALRDAARPFSEILLRAGQLRDLTAENAALRNRVGRLEADLATLREQQIAVVEDMIARGVSGIVLAPLDKSGLRQVVREAKSAGIPTVCVDSGLEGDDQLESVRKELTADLEQHCPRGFPGTIT